jgi:hypothetical protein
MLLLCKPMMRRRGAEHSAVKTAWSRRALLGRESSAAVSSALLVNRERER